MLIPALLFSIAFAREVDAGMSDYFSRMGKWWTRGTIRGDAARHDGGIEKNDIGDDEGGDGDDGDDTVKEGRLPGMCKVPQEPALMRCEIGSGFLCIDTPPGGVSGDLVRIRGTMDRQGSVLGSVRIAVQHEYTKKIEYVDTSSPKTSACWDEATDDSFCIDSSGLFSAAVPLWDAGPYTISMSASRLSGGSVEKKIRTSKVVAPAFDGEKVAFDPDIKTSKVVDASMVMVTVDLLGECNFCDFIGASTGGVTVSVENEMQDPIGGTKSISCPTTVEQGGQGRFIIGVPVEPGKNSISVSVCNAAAEPDCPKTGEISFTAAGEIAALKTVSPPPQPIYDSDEYPVILWKFSMGGGVSCVEMRFNREPPKEVCADAGGEFSVELLPRFGINVATLGAQDGSEQFAWTFGWGRAQSPFDGDVSSVEVPAAFGVALSKEMIGDTLIPFINNFLSSDEFYPFVFGMLASNPAKPPEEKKADSGDGVREKPAIPRCEEGGGLGKYLISLGGVPTIGALGLSDFSLEEDRLNLSLSVNGLRIQINLAPDEDGDGKGDKDPLPLIISFKEAKFDVALAGGKDDAGDGLLLLTSSHDDCEYKDSGYCKHIPSSLVPKNFVGDATPWGNFVRCDVDSAGSEAVEACRAINSVNAQTGVVSEMILDAINSAVYCGGSAMLTKFTREYLNVPVEMGCFDDGPCEGIVGKILPAMKLPLGVKLEDGIDFSTSALAAKVALSVGDDEFFGKTPERFHISSAGSVTGDSPDKISISAKLVAGYDVGALLSLDAVGAVLYALVAHGDGRDVRGFLDFDIHELFFDETGFDFVKECDAFEPIPGVKDKLPTLCFVRPRVIDLLGSSLTTYGYFPAKQPLIMSLRGSRALAPRISVTTLDELPIVPRTGEVDMSGESDVPDGNLVELQLGGVELSFYAIEVDKGRPVDDYGNLPIKVDSDGKPVIHSMRPDDPDPWNGPIVSFDVTLLLGLEFGDLEYDPEAGSDFVIRVRPLADRSRLILSPIEGSNVTTIPSRKLISNLADQLMTAIAQLSPKQSAIPIPIPRDFAFEDSDDGGLFSSIGLKKISVSSDGLSLDFDPELNTVKIAVKAIIEQVLHVGEDEMTYILPNN